MNKALLLQSAVMFTRPPGFIYKDNELHCERVPLSKLAEKYGTPLYIYSATAVRERYSVLNEAFHNVAHTICYSVKANSNLSLLRLLAKLGAGFDIVSAGELERVRVTRKQALKNVVFSGVGKTEEELVAALRAGILLFNVESEGELNLLSRCAAKLRKPANVALRVNPDFPQKPILMFPPGCKSTSSEFPLLRRGTFIVKQHNTSICKLPESVSISVRRSAMLRLSVWPWNAQSN
jgi:diaminopimelate decarboxylase